MSSIFSSNWQPAIHLHLHLEQTIYKIDYPWKEKLTINSRLSSKRFPKVIPMNFNKVIFFNKTIQRLVKYFSVNANIPWHRIPNISRDSILSFDHEEGTVVPIHSQGERPKTDEII